MNVLYFDCSMGAAGDMLSAALLELLPEPGAFLEELNHVGIPHVTVTRETSVKCGIAGTHLCVKVDGQEEDEQLHDHPHHGSGMEQISRIVSGLSVSSDVRKDILAVYELIARAESHVHNAPVSQIHFHEVGAMDAVADITAFCMLMEKLGRPRVTASPIHLGSGTVRCAHGLLPVPAPATAYLLEGIPVYTGTIQSELCTPTGAALLKHFASGFGPMPVMTMQKVGYGMGKKDFEQANCVRAMLGTQSGNTEAVVELSCNLDDMTPEEIGFAMEVLLNEGALDVWTSPIGMKKCRPGVMLSVLCREADEDTFVRLLFAHTSTIGIRETGHRRFCLERSQETFSTAFGDVTVKRSEGYGVTKRKPEYEDVARIARENGISIAQVKKSI